MEFLRQLDTLPSQLTGGAVTIGNFDGVHRGHGLLVQRLRSLAAGLRGPAIVFTFDPHPVRLLRPTQAPPPLTWAERKAELLAELGVDAMIAYPTDEALLQLSPEAFFQQVIVQALRARAIVEGPNFCFGHQRTGDVQTLEQLCQESGIALEIVPPCEHEGAIVSSSRIRDAIRAGRVAEAAAMLTRPYRIRGMVTHGTARGAKLGFPTANLSAVDTLVPALGVYAGRASTGGQSHAAAIHIGPNLTFGEDHVKLEVHLLNFQGNLYGQPLEVDFLARLRDIQPFADVVALKDQLAMDIQRTAQLVSAAPDPLSH